jgi:hypothetical protein
VSTLLVVIAVKVWYNHGQWGDLPEIRLVADPTVVIKTGGLSKAPFWLGP